MRRLVLAGAGHAHALVLRELARQRPAGVEVVLIAPVTQAPYSGMIPGWLAGAYRWEECCIDFERLCQRAGVALRVDAIARLDPDLRTVQLSSGDVVSYDWLSLNVGSSLYPPDSEGMMVLPMRPLDALRARWEGLQQIVTQLHEVSPLGAPFRILAVGGGASGVESILAASHTLRRIAPQANLNFALATQDSDILPGIATGAARRLRRHLAARSIDVATDFRVVHIAAGDITAEDGRCMQADAILWAPGAQAYPWLRESGLATDAGGFVRVDASLRSLSHPDVFAAGDCAAWSPPLPKAGVFSVRMGPVLAHNLLSAMQGRPLQPYAPQRRYLALIGTGGDHAVAAWGGFAWEGDWVWRWKQAIDRKFVVLLNED